MEKVVVLVETEVNPTETEEKVKLAIANIFGNIPTAITPRNIGSTLNAGGEGASILSNFRDIVRRDSVRAATRKTLFTKLKENTIVFYLNKQAAFSNHVSFSQETGESPLDPIKVTIKCRNPSELIDWLAPKTQ